MKIFDFRLWMLLLPLAYYFLFYFEITCLLPALTSCLCPVSRSPVIGGHTLLCFTCVQSSRPLHPHVFKLRAPLVLLVSLWVHVQYNSGLFCLFPAFTCSLREFGFFSFFVLSLSYQTSLDILCSALRVQKNLEKKEQLELIYSFLFPLLTQFERNSFKVF